MNLERYREDRTYHAQNRHAEIIAMAMKPRTKLKGEGLVMDEKPLFIPLRREWFELIEAGEKSTEYRAYGARWNERTCRPGRPVVLSLGYGKARRLRKVVSGFRVLDWAEAPSEARAIYPDAAFIAAIGLGVGP